MKTKRLFAWTFGIRADALTAVNFLSDRDSRNSISQLFVGDVHIDSIDTFDVLSVTLTHSHAGYWTVSAVTAFEVDIDSENNDDDEARLAFSPYGFDGEYDLPRLLTYGPDETGALVATHGEPHTWGDIVQ